MGERLVEGREFSGRPRVLSAARILAFSGGPLAPEGWPAKNLHTDPAKAAEAGLSAPIASGIQCEADLVRLLTDIFGNAWLQHGKLHVKYPRPVYAGAVVQPHARVRACRAGEHGTVVELEVWCETADEATVVVGTASCLNQS